jgi:hypothetical protein
MKLDVFISVGTGIALRSAVFRVIIKVLFSYIVFSVRFSLWTWKFVLCEVELKSEVLYILRIKAVLKVLTFGSAFIHYTYVELIIICT